MKFQVFFLIWENAGDYPILKVFYSPIPLFTCWKVAKIKTILKNIITSDLSNTPQIWCNEIKRSSFVSFDSLLIDYYDYDNIICIALLRNHINWY